MNISFNEENILLIVCTFLFSTIVYIIVFYLFFRKDRINILNMRSIVENLKKYISELENKKNEIDSNIYELIKEEEKIKSDIKNKNIILKDLDTSITRKTNKFEEEEDIHNKKIKELNDEIYSLDLKTKKLQELERNANEIGKKIELWNEVKDKIEDDKKILHQLQSKIDLYSQIDDFVEYGFFSTPDYLYKTSERYAIDIEEIRNKQKELIKNKIVITGQNYEKDSRLSFITKILESQKILIIRAFNIECDFLISKVNAANFERILKRIKSVADSLEKLMADMRFGINEEYVLLKMQECKLKYESELLKKQQAEEQRAIREQIREEQKAKREYERELLAAEREERKYIDLLESAKQSISSATGTALQKAELRIKELETKLALAIARAERAKSMAEQTKYGHVYVISNIGSFGEDIYKIGLTRRLDPTERVRELGDASVPFPFDIHAMIVSNDAPALEHALHVAFDTKRVNAVNNRKEFFKVSLEEIQQKVNEITGGHAEFIMTKKADEYYQTKRLQQL